MRSKLVKISVLLAYLTAIVPAATILTGCEQLGLGGGEDDEDDDKKKKKKKKGDDDDDDDDDDKDDKKKKKKKKGGDEIGIKECDKYFDTFEACDFGPAQDAMDDALDQNRKAWKDMADQGGAMEDALKDACKQALKTLEDNPACK